MNLSLPKKPVITLPPGLRLSTSVDRYLATLPVTLTRNLSWVSNEKNGETLWTRIRQSVTNTLTNDWQRGLILGDKPDKAFYVKCDRTTMTQDDINQGTLVVVIGVAPVKPAEFVVVRIGLWAQQPAKKDPNDP